MKRLVLLVACVAATPAFAQSLPSWASPPEAADRPQADASSMPPGIPTEPAPVPIDGGLSLLALAGAGLAARKLRQRAA